MRKRKKSSAKVAIFGAVLLLVVVLAAVGLHRGSTPKLASPIIANGQSTSQPSGWLTYCDKSAAVCFGYPPDWKLHSTKSSAAGDNELLINPTGTISADYANFPASIGDPKVIFTSDPLSTAEPAANVTISIAGVADFHVTSIDNLSGKADAYAVVGGYYASDSENIPAYITMPKLSVSVLSLKVGQISKIPNAAFNISNHKQAANILLFGVGPITDKPYTSQQAADWLNSADGKLSKQFAQSFRMQ